MNVKEIERPGLYKLHGYLEAISDVVRSGELKWEFEVTLYEYESPNLDVGQLVKAAYPDSRPEKAEIIECSLEDMRETFQHELSKGLSAIEAKRILQPTLDLSSGMWQYLSECIDYRQSRFFEFLPSGEPNGLIAGLLGEFAFIICDENTHRYLILLAVTCD